MRTENSGENIRILYLRYEGPTKTRKKFVILAKISEWYTVKTPYNVTGYNRIFNIRHKIAGNKSVSFKIPSS